MPHGDLLVAFAEGSSRRRRQGAGETRNALTKALNPSGLVDDEGVVGLFNAIDRFAVRRGSRWSRRKQRPVSLSLDLDRFAVAERT